MHHRAALAGLALLLVLPTVGHGEDEPGDAASPSGEGSMDEWQDKARSFLGRQVEQVDMLFVGEDEAPQPMPQPRLRLGLLGEVTVDTRDSAEFKPLIDIEVDVKFPNIERRLSVFVSTTDPTALPGDDVVDQENELRIGANGTWWESIKVSIGVRVNTWPPVAYTVASWSPTYEVGDAQLYTTYKAFGESGDGVGALTSVVFDRWRGRWDFRQSVSLKWTETDAQSDLDASSDPESEKFGKDGGGWRWEYSTIFGYAEKLLDESDLGRRIKGSDLADGYGVRLSFNGDIKQAAQVRTTFLRKASLHSDWLYYVIAPEVSWEDENRWVREFVIKFGLEAHL